MYLHNFDLMEDKAIIKAQQKLSTLSSTLELLAMAADAALVHFRRLFAQRLQADQEQARSAV